MGYYMSGGYYRAGGYYRGGGFFKKLGKAVGNFAPQLGALAGGAIGGPAGAMIGGALAKTLAPGTKQASPGAGVFDSPLKFPMGNQLPVLGPAGAAQVRDQLMRQGGSAGQLVATDAMMASHPSSIIYPGKKYRRMNPLNPRALRRSMRRVQSFAKFARKTISFSQRVKMKKRGRR